MLELATAADRDDINRMARQVYELHISWRPDIYRMPEEMYPQGRFDEAVKARELYVAKLGRQTVGYANIRIREVENPGLVKRWILLLDEICVDEFCRNQGIGSQMMTEIKLLARAFGCSDLQLSVYPQNDEAVSFYQKNGLMIQNITMQMKVK